MLKTSQEWQEKIKYVVSTEDGDEVYPTLKEALEMAEEAWEFEMVRGDIIVKIVKEKIVKILRV